MASKEIERKFLVRGPGFKELAYKRFTIAQGYLTTDPERSVRIRIRDDKGYITVKGPSSKDGTTRFEWEKEISQKDARSLLELCQPGVINKKRHLVKAEGHTFEVDEFTGANAGLVIAEVELQHVEEKFHKPPWLGKEVTGDPRYYNAHLSRLPFKEW